MNIKTLNSSVKILIDLKEYSKGSKFPKGILNIIFYINVIYRISNFFDSINLFSIAKIFWAINRVIFSVDIDPRAKIAGGFVIKHGLGLVIGAYVEIGEKFTVYQGVTIGGNAGKTRPYNGVVLKQPLIGSNVTISPNSVVIGPIVLQDCVQVGACSLVSKDVAMKSTVVGNNKIVKNNPQ